MIEPQEELLHRYLDDALSPEEAEAFAARLAEDAALAEEVAILEAARGLLRADIAAALDAADFSGFADAVAEGLEGVEIAPAPTPRAPVVEPASGGLRAWWQQYWTPLVVSVAAAAVIAALMFQTRPRPDAEDDGVGVANGAVTVDSIQNGGNKTVRVAMPSADGEATVIWMLDDEEEDSPDGGPAAGEDPI